MIYFELFWSFFQIGLFSFGGGYASLPLIQNQVVDQHQWLNMKEFSDIITISQMTPGPIAINSATFVGTRLGGFAGSCVATFGCVLPSCIIVFVLSVIYMKYRNLTLVQETLQVMRPGVVGLIGSAGFSLIILSLFGTMDILAIKSIDFVAVLLFIVSLFILRRYKLNPIVVMLICGAGGLLLYTFI